MKIEYKTIDDMVFDDIEKAEAHEKALFEKALMQMPWCSLLEALDAEKEDEYHGTDVEILRSLLFKAWSKGATL